MQRHGELTSEESTGFSCRYNSGPEYSDTLVIALTLREGLKVRFQPSVIRDDMSL